MLFPIFLALFLPCVGMSAVFVVYICLLWFATNARMSSAEPRLPVKQVSGKGLSASDLEKFPKTSGKKLTRDTGCAVFLDEIQAEQPVRVVPGCNRGFHLQCADACLSKQSFCPVCKAKLHPPQIIVITTTSSDENPC